MKTIFRRELKSYFSGMSAYIIIAFMLCVIGFFSSYYNFTQGFPIIEISLYSVVFIYLILVPFLTMRTFAQENQDKTMTLLYSLPIKTSDIVLGKFFSTITVYTVPMLFICLYPLILSLFGKVNFLQSYLFIIAFYLLGVALISIGIFVSSMAQTQVVAAVSTLGALLFVYLLPDISMMLPATPVASAIAICVIVLLISCAVYFLTSNLELSLYIAAFGCVAVWVVYFIKKELFEGLIQSILDKLALFTRIDTFLNGICDITAYVLYLSIIAVFLFLTVQALERKRYN
ncbi:MAG: ABC transporter [Ruminococcaceae bacterium]|nr:ABC transporter [Oscillospiraceae bacterium]